MFRVYPTIQLKKLVRDNYSIPIRGVDFLFSEKKFIRARLWGSTGMSYYLTQVQDFYDPGQIEFVGKVLRGAPFTFLSPPLPTRAETVVSYGLRRGFQIYPWLPGVPRVPKGSLSFYRAGSVLAKIHAWLFLRTNTELLPSIPLSSFSEDVEKHFTDVNLGHPGWRSFLASCERGLNLLKSLPRAVSTQLVHGDFHPFNLLWEYEEISGVVDWNDCHFSSPLFDVARYLVYSTCVHWDMSHFPQVRGELSQEIDREAGKSFLLGYLESCPQGSLSFQGFHRELVHALMAVLASVLLPNAQNEYLFKQRLREFSETDSIDFWGLKLIG